MPLRLYIYGAVLIAFLGLGTFAGCTYKANKKLTVALELARDANRSNIVTLDTQARALEQWKALHKTPEQVLTIVSNAQAYVDEIDRLTKQVRFYRDKDKSLPECVALLNASLSRLCPGTAYSLRLRATGQNGDGRSANSRHPESTVSAHQRLPAALSLSRD